MVSTALWATDNLSPSACYSVPGAHHYTPKRTSGSRLCYSAETRRLPSPQTMEAKTPHSLPARQQSLPHQRFPTERRKAITCYSAGNTRSPVSPRYTEAQCFTLHLPTGQSGLSCPRAGIPVPPLSGTLPLCWY
jgi:hypothetical protein